MFMKEGKKERKEDLIANANAGGEKQGKGIETKRLHEKKKYKKDQKHRIKTSAFGNRQRSEFLLRPMQGYTSAHSEKQTTTTITKNPSPDPDPYPKRKNPKNHWS